MKKIYLTLKMLDQFNACGSQRQLFETFFGQRVLLTKKLITPAICRDFHVDWLSRLLDEHESKLYDKARRRAHAEYDKAESATYRSYDRGKNAAKKRKNMATNEALRMRKSAKRDNVLSAVWDAFCEDISVIGARLDGKVKKLREKRDMALGRAFLRCYLRQKGGL